METMLYSELYISMDRTKLETDVKNGLSTYDLAKKYNRGQTTMRYWLRKYHLSTFPIGSKSRRTTQRKQKTTKYENIDWDKWQSLYDSGKSWNELSKIYSSTSIAWALKNGKIKTRKRSESCKLAWKNGKHSIDTFRTPEHRKKMRRFGGYKQKAGRCAHLKYIMKDGSVIDLQGSWEYTFAEFLDSKNVTWNRNRIGHKYSYNGKTNCYYPDFYVPVLNLYIEVKGYETNRDREKWKQFPFLLLVVKKEDIKDLDKWWNINEKHFHGSIA